MAEFEPSANFVNRTMERVRSYELERSRKLDRLDSVLLSRRMRFALCVSAVLLGMLNLIRIASTLIAPAICL